jgi:DNA (cytosine-5)-methyltransferase 1|tara:strand:- start:323 stop:892 length:570 start_codon:yes stop_codon:yes gene_type:complete
MKILNLYAGIGGNRWLWKDVEVTAVEINEEIAGIYKSHFPQDEVIVGDAHQYLLEHYKEFDFIWSSPPCPTHSRLCYSKSVKQYPSMVLWQEIIFLKTWFKGKWVVENVLPYYEPLIEPRVLIGRHCFWSNFKIPKIPFTNIDVSRATQEELSNELNIPSPMIKSRLLLRNCVHPKMGLHLFKSIPKDL